MVRALVTVLSRKHGATFQQLFRFAVSTGMSALATVGLPMVLHEIAGIEPRLAVGISQCSAFVLNFFMIRSFVFRSVGRRSRDLLWYLGSTAVFRSLEYVFFLFLFDVARLYYASALVCTLAISTAIKFLWYRLLFNSREVA